MSRCEAAAVRPGSGWQGWSLRSPSSELTQERGGLDWLPGVGAQPPRALGVQDTPGALTPSCSPTVLPPPVASTPTDTLPLPASPGHGACWTPPSIIYTWEGKARMRGFFSRMG